MKTLWTPAKARLKPIRTQPGDYNWLFLPGGPGLGSESLKELTDLLTLPGTLWHLDLPGDGSNLISNESNAFSHWSQALIEACASLANVILVAHSTGGMFALSTPELETKLKGLVLIASAPDASFQESFADYVKNYPLLNTEKLQSDYDANPSHETLKKLTIAYAPYVATQSGLKAVISLMETLPFNAESNQWSAEHFDQTYKAKWIPKEIPVLIIAGDKDYLTPPTLFLEHPDFQRENISIKTIANASHFPWLENPEQVKEVFETYYLNLLNLG